MNNRDRPAPEVSAMSDFDADRDPLDLLAEDFADRCRRGERPSVDTYVEKYPEWAAQIRELLPPVARMEELKRLRRTAHGLAAEGTPLERLGDYRILREVGRGGMGVVYEAVQESLGRQVALKVLARQALLDPKKRERFQREAQAAARLHHTNIVPVFGVGEQDGLPYYVMQFIQGEGLNEVLARWRRGKTGAKRPEGKTLSATGALPETLGANPLPATELPTGRPWREIARIGIQAAEALHYAHQQNILHRDIKPGNLLLDGHGTVWVTDFGLAKAVGQKDLTDSGDIVGTLQYMAPENFQGQADARSDVYSLGLTLYELLTREAPFHGTTVADLLKQVTDQEPTGPRKLNPAIPRDLETIILKAIARDPGHRYQTAEALAEDLRRFLADRPIRARRATLPERGWRWCRRNRALAALTAAALAALVLAAAAGWVGYVHTTRALAGEARKSEEAAAATRRAEANEELCLQKFEEIFNSLAERDPGLTFRPRPWDRRGGPGFRLPPSEEDANLLKSILSFYDQFAERNNTNPRLQKEAAKAHRRVAQIYQRLGQLEKAGTAVSRAAAIYDQLATAFPSVTDYRHELAETWTLFDIQTSRKETLPEAESQLRRVLAMQQELADSDPGVARYTATLARLRGKLGAVLRRRGQTAEAEENLRQAAALLESLVQRGSPGKTLPGFSYRYDLALARHCLARLLLKSDRLPEARSLLEKSIAELEKPGRGRMPFPPGQTLLAAHYQSLAQALTGLGETKLAANASAKAKRLGERGRRPPRGGVLPGPVGR
jgi:serine/threonine protein kinase